MFSIVKLIDGIKKRVPVLPVVKGSGSNVIWREGKDYLEASSDLEAQNVVVLETLRAAHVDVDNDMTVHGNLYVSGSTITTDEATLETGSPYVVLRKDNPSGLGINEKAGIVIHNYQVGKDAFIGVDANGTFRISDNAIESKVDYTQVANINGQWYKYLLGAYNPLPEEPKGDVIVSEEVWEYENSFMIGNVPYHVVEGAAFEIKGKDLSTEPSEVDIPATLIKYIYYPFISFLNIIDSENEPLLTRNESDNMKSSVMLWDGETQKAVTTDLPTINGQVLSAKIDDDGIKYEWANSTGGGGTYIFDTEADFIAAKALIPGQEGYIPSNSTIIIKDKTTDLIGENR